MGPINMFMTGFSRLPAKQPYFDEKGFPELQTLTDNWQVIREEAVRLQDHIKKRSRTTMPASTPSSNAAGSVSI